MTTVYQAASHVEYAYVPDGYGSYRAAGLIRAWGWDLYRRRREGYVVLGRMYRGGKEATWSHGCGINSTCPPGGVADWVELEYTGGDPVEPASWRPTGRTWTIGGDDPAPEKSSPTVGRPTRRICGLCGGTGRSRDRGMREPVCDICSRDGAARLAMLEAAGLRVVESESSRG